MTRVIDFEVIASLDSFFFSEKFISLVCGPIGSTKTTAGIMKIIHHAAMMAPCEDGIRRSRCVWVRNTREQLRDTSIPDFTKWIRPDEMGVFLKTEYKFIIKLGDIECEVLFRGLDDQNDVRRLLSLQASFIVFDEFREIHPDIYNAAQGRVGRYPDKMMNGVGCVRDDGASNAHVWGMTNPPDADTFWEELLTDPPDNVEVTFQPSGLAPEADWTKFLPDDYYDNLAQGKTEDWIDVYIHAKFGKSLSGQPVFRSFDRSGHVAPRPIKPMFTGNPLIIGADAGLTPAAVIGEQAYDGRLVIYDAITAEDMGALRFIQEKLKPLLTTKFPGRSALVIVDPAATQRVQTDERSVADIYRSEGFLIKPARTNSVAARLAAVEKYLTRIVDGKYGMVIDPESGLPLIQALTGKYRYRINTKGVRDESPEKSHPWSDLCFVGGTPIDTPAGPVSVEDLAVGDQVCVPDGVDTVVGVGNHDAEQLVELEFSDGTVLTCTPDHPFYVKSHSCFVRADTLQYAHVLETVEDGVWASGTTAPLRVIRRSFVGSGRVYNLTTQRTHLYYADGKLVHNCDALQYLCLHADGGELFGAAIAEQRREVRRVAAGGWT